MGNTADKSASSPLLELVEKIITDGRITKEDQVSLSVRAKDASSAVDFEAIQKLTDLVKEGVVKAA